MESIFFIVLTSLLIEAFKWSVAKIGTKATTWIIYLGVAVISGIWTYLRVSNILTDEFISQFMIYATGSIATYEVIIKSLIKKGIVPLFQKPQ